MSPRSFLTAFREAAESTDSRYHSHRLPLHYEAIKDGVRAAWPVRVSEIREDIEWIDIAMQPLRGLRVPLEMSESVDAWRTAETVERLSERLERPQRIDEGFAGLIAELEELGVLERRTAGRINVPDVFRVAFELGRKGGVKPAR